MKTEALLVGLFLWALYNGDFPEALVLLVRWVLMALEYYRAADAQA